MAEITPTEKAFLDSQELQKLLGATQYISLEMDYSKNTHLPFNDCIEAYLRKIRTIFNISEDGLSNYVVREFLSLSYSGYLSFHKEAELYIEIRKLKEQIKTLSPDK